MFAAARLVAMLGALALAWPAPALADEINVYDHIAATDLDPALADLRPLVYVPNEHGASLTVIDATTMTVIKTIGVGSYPHHVTPAWDMRSLFVNNMNSGSLTVIDPWSVRKVGLRRVRAPYNLYFTPDGSTAIDIAEPLDRIVFYERATWTKLGRVLIPSRGVDHVDFSADGDYFLASTEYGGWIYKISVAARQIVGALKVGGKPVDVKLSADGAVFYVANQGRNGVSVIDPTSMTEVAFLATGAGAHGMAVSRDGTQLYVSNRRAGTISVIDFATRAVVATWNVGRSPDMLNVSIDGAQLWVSNRWHDSVSVIDTSDGQVIRRIRVGDAPHGLTYFPQPGRFSIGHNGVYR
ncbi:MAG TPA: cytochrome D1 domain-containing protein [Candidatus Limnocylindrales bacterium]|nr:cytochrome D1 domain-containing protein [Candidatus Limnocylindrales bacterium]